jgi:hypothetical protein
MDTIVILENIAIMTAIFTLVTMVGMVTIIILDTTVIFVAIVSTFTNVIR